MSARPSPDPSAAPLRPRASAPRARLWRKHYLLPAEHGVWSWWLGPLVVGLAAAGRPDPAFLWLVLAALFCFFLHQPATIAVKALSGRRPRRDLRPAAFWVGVHGTVAAAAALGLYLAGHTRPLLLAAPGVPFFAFHLWLVSRKAERRQMLVEVVGAGVLALTAPAAYWTAGGENYPEPWVLWALTWAQSASAIANVYLRLEQRRWPAVPAAGGRVRAGRGTLSFHVLGVALAGAFVAVGLAPAFVLVAFAVPLADAVDSVRRPMIGVRPARIGIRQLVVTVAFVALMILAYVV